MSALILTALAVASLVMACVPAWRRRFHWGRTKDSYSASKVGCLGAAVAFLTMAAGLAGQQLHFLSDFVALMLLFGGSAAFMLVGILDRYSSMGTRDGDGSERRGSTGASSSDRKR